MSRVLLLDFDGVFIRNRKISSYVGTQCTRLLAHKKNLNMKQARKINSHLYPLYGHTSFILSKEYGIDCSIKDFNDIVYHEYINYKHIHNMITVNDVEYADQLVSKIVSKHDNVFIFTNAVDTWCMEVLRMLHIQDCIPRSHILSSDLLPVLKPDHKAYDKVDRMLEIFQPNAKQRIFVDDQLANIDPIINKTNWTGIYYPPMQTLDYLEKQICQNLK